MSVPDKEWSLGLGNILDIPTIMFLYFCFIKWIKVLYKLKISPGLLFNTLFVPTWTITRVYLLSLIMLDLILWINSPIVSPLYGNISASLIPVKKLSKSYQTIRYLITGELYSVTIYMNYLNRCLCETNLTKITIFFTYKKIPIMAQMTQINL